MSEVAAAVPGDGGGGSGGKQNKKNRNRTKKQQNNKQQSDNIGDQTETTAIVDQGEAPPTPSAEEITLLQELAVLSAEKSSLEKQRMNDKAVRTLDQSLSGCKAVAEEIKDQVLQVLQDRTGCEENCIKLEQNIGEKLNALTNDVQKSAKECMESFSEEPDSDAKNALASVLNRERRSSSKSATPPPLEKEKAIQEKITDLSKLDPKKVSASTKKKAFDTVLRSLGEFETVDDKLRALCELHFDTLEQLREAQVTADKWKKQVQAGQKDCNRSLLARDRLEGLCRELQKQNNAIKEESLLRRREEEEKRKQIAAKFQSTLGDISGLMADTQETSSKLRQDNAQLAGKLRSLVNHYEMWEKHAETMLRQKSVETELAQAKLRESQLYREKESKEAEATQKILEATVKQLQQQLEVSIKNEIILREQLKIHNEKYEEFQGAILTSNKMFSDFRGEVENMGKQSRKFEKEAVHWKQRWEEANLATARVLQEKTKSDVKAETLTRLCRSLQDKLKIDSQEMAGMEKTVTGAVIAEEKQKLEAELQRKQADIEEQKRILQERQKEMQLKMVEEDLKAKALEKEIAQVQEAATTKTNEGETVTEKQLEQDPQVVPEIPKNETKPQESKKKGKKKH